MANGAVVAEGFDRATLDAALLQLAPGETYTLRLYTEAYVPPDQIDLIQQELEKQGVEVKSIVQDAGVLVITFVEPEPVSGIGFILWPVFVIGAGWFGWQITKEVSGTVQAIPTVAWILGGAALLLIAWKFVSPGKKVSS